MQQAVLAEASPSRGHPNQLVAGILVLLFIIGSLAGDPKESVTKLDADDAAGPAPAQPSVEVTAAQLFQAYDENEARAQQTYGKKKLRVRGTVAAIDLGIGDKPTIQLVSPNEFMPVTIQNSESVDRIAASLNKGQSISARCTSVTEIMGRPFLDGCTIE